MNVANTRCGHSDYECEGGQELEGPSNLFTHPRCKRVRREVKDVWDEFLTEEHNDADEEGQEEVCVGEDAPAVRTALREYKIQAEQARTMTSSQDDSSDDY